MTPQLADEIVTFFCRHLVMLGCTIVDLDERGEQKGEERFCAFSGTVLSLGGRWHIATAGHIFCDLERAITRREIQIHSMTVADYFGLNAGSRLPIPFDFMIARKVWRFDAGLDFALLSPA